MLERVPADPTLPVKRVDDEVIAEVADVMHVPTFNSVA